MAVYKKVPGHKTVNISTLEFDTTPTPGSLNPVTSGGVAEVTGKTSSNIAPDYTKTTYPANSYVMHDGVLYTNPNAIGTAEDWNPAHWAQTTVAEMMANAGATQWTHKTLSLSINGGATEQIDIQDHEVVDLTLRKGTGSGFGNLNMHLHGECYVIVDKVGVKVYTYTDDSNTSTTDTNTGSPNLSISDDFAMSPVGSGAPDEYDPTEFNTIPVITDAQLNIDTPSLTNTGVMKVLLHFLGEGTLIITPLP